jgi:hypothetical protein
MTLSVRREAPTNPLFAATSTIFPNIGWSRKVCGNFANTFRISYHVWPILVPGRKSSSWSGRLDPAGLPQRRLPSVYAALHTKRPFLKPVWVYRGSLDVWSRTALATHHNSWKATQPSLMDQVWRTRLTSLHSVLRLAHRGYHRTPTSTTKLSIG